MMTDLYNEIVEYQKMNFDKDQLIADFAQAILNGMDLKTMECFVYDTLVENLSEYSNETLIEEVRNYNPELLEDAEGI